MSASASVGVSVSVRVRNGPRRGIAWSLSHRRDSQKDNLAYPTSLPALPLNPPIGDTVRVRVRVRIEFAK